MFFCNPILLLFSIQHFYIKTKYCSKFDSLIYVNAKVIALNTTFDGLFLWAVRIIVIQYFRFSVSFIFMQKQILSTYFIHVNKNDMAQNLIFRQTFIWKVSNPVIRTHLFPSPNVFFLYET